MKSYLLGIDTSCDDTSMAILEQSSQTVLSNIVSSQFKVHEPHGGIVPELASRAHMENMALVFEQALKQAGIQKNDLAAIAVTKTPGLMGCLLVGTSFAKGLAYQLQIPLYGVNHLEGHLYSPFIENEARFPALGLVVSGGHTAFYHIKSYEESELIGQTVDDAAGEAFDKCAKMMGLGYPGGPVIDKRAVNGNDKAYAFTNARVKMGAQYLSFSGLKTAAFHYIQSETELTQSVCDDLCASIQAGIVTALIQKLKYFAAERTYRAFCMSGGVALNSLLRKRAQAVCDDLGLPCLIAAPQYCADNGAMIGHVVLKRPLVDELYTLNTRATRKVNAREMSKNAKADPHKG